MPLKHTINRTIALLAVFIIITSLITPKFTMGTVPIVNLATETRTISLATPTTLTQDINPALTYTPLSTAGLTPQGYCAVTEDRTEDSDYIVSGGALTANPYIEYEIEQAYADALTIYPKDDITSPTTTAYTHINHAEIVALTPIQTTPATITIERTNHRFNPPTIIRTTYSIYAEGTSITEDALTILKDSSTGRVPVTTQDTAFNTEQYILADGKTGTFTYKGEVSIYNQDSKKTDTLYYGIAYRLESDNEAVIDPIAKTYTHDETAYEFRTNATGTATLTLSARTAILSRQSQETGGYIYTIFEEDPVTLDEIRVSSVASDLKITSLSKLTLSIGETSPITIKATNRHSTGYIYKTANQKIAAVSETGVITALKKGSTTITVTDGISTKKIKVSVKQADVKTENITQTVGTRTYKELIKNRAPNATYTYKVSNPKIANVSSTGAITALKKGKTTIKIYEKLSSTRTVGTIKLKVKARAGEDIDIIPDLYNAEEDIYMLTVPSNTAFDIKDYLSADNKDTAALTYKSSAKGITVSKNGLVKAASGEAALTIKSGKESVTLNIKTIPPKQDATDQKRVKAAKALCKLAYLVDENTYKVPTTFAEIEELTNQYIEAYNMANACDADIIAGLDNYAPIPNISLLKKAKKVLDYTFAVMGASADLRVEPQSMKDSVITLKKDIPKIDILYYCYLNKKQYREGASIEYKAEYDGTAYVKEYEAAASSDPYVNAVSMDGRTAYVGVVDNNPVSLNGTPVTRQVKQTITLLYKESVTGDVFENREPSTIKKTYLIDTAHYGGAIVDPLNNYAVVGNITPGSEIYIQDEVYEDFGTPTQKNYFTYDILEVSEPEFIDTESYIYKSVGADEVISAYAVGSGRTLNLIDGASSTEIVPDKTPATITISGYQFIVS